MTTPQGNWAYFQECFAAGDGKLVATKRIDSHRRYTVHMQYSADDMRDVIFVICLFDANNNTCHRATALEYRSREEAVEQIKALTLQKIAI